MSAPRLRQLLIISVLVLSSVTTNAQLHPALDRGFKADGSYQVGDLDSINVFNGNVNVRVPLGTFPVADRLSYALGVTYNSKLWEYDEKIVKGATTFMALPSRTSNAGMGWEVSLGRLVTRRTPGAPKISQWAYESADGSQHLFYDTLVEGDLIVPNVAYTRDGSYLRLRITGNQWLISYPDGTMYTFESKFGKLLSITDAFGNTVTLREAVSEGPCTGSAMTWVIEDTGSPNRRQYVCFKDSVYPESIYSSRMVDKVVITSVGGTPAVYQFNYTNSSVTRGCGDTDPFDSVSVNVPLLQSIADPLGRLYSFTYNVTQTTSDSCDQGALASLQLPTRGSVGWVYQPYIIPTEGCKYLTYAHSSPGVAKRTLLNETGAATGTWTYETKVSADLPPQWCETLTTDPHFGSPPAEELRNTVTAPDGNKMVHYFSVWPNQESNVATPFLATEYGLPLTRRPSTDSGTGLLLSTEFFDCSSGRCPGTPSRRTFVAYALDPSPIGCVGGSDCSQANRRLTASRTNYEDGRYTYSTSSDWDGVGHYRVVTAGGTVGEVARPDKKMFRTNYLGKPLPISPWITGIFDYTIAQEDADRTEAQYCFDATTGFLNGQRTLLQPGSLQGNGLLQADGVRSQNDLLAKSVRVSAASQTQLWAGGSQTIPNDSTCPNVPGRYRVNQSFSLGLLTTSTYVDVNTNQVIAFKSIDQDIDPYVGVITHKRAPDRLQTDFSYDVLGRLVSAGPATATNRLGRATIVYNDATSRSLPNLEIRHQSADGSTLLENAFLDFDAFGRVIQERWRMPGCGGQAVEPPCVNNASSVWSFRQTAYDAMGRKYRVSETEDYQGVSARNWTSFAFDPFGRTNSITRPDGTITSIGYTGISSVSTTEKIGSPPRAATTTRSSDSFGRLRSVSEPAGTPDSAGLNGPVDTTYYYDVADHLVLVRQGQQFRGFTYDPLGFLKMETPTEMNGGQISYSDHDAKGHVGSKRIVADATGAKTLSYSFDAAERLLSVSNGPAGFAKPLKEFVYDGVSYDAPFNGLQAYQRIGSLLRSRRHNYASDGADDVVQEEFQYEGREGALSTKRTAVLHQPVGGPASRTQSFGQQFEYSDLGDINTTVYPDCQVQCAGAYRKIVDSFSLGKLTSVMGIAVDGTPAIYSPSITYNPTGGIRAVSQSALPNPATGEPLDRYREDSMGRTSSIEFTGLLCTAAPQIVTPPLTQTVAPGANVTLTAAASGANLQYQWYEGSFAGGTAIPGAITPSYSFTASTTPGTYRYWVAAKNICGEVVSAVATVTVSSPCVPLAITSGPQSATIPPGGSVTLSVTVTGSTPQTFQWYEGVAPDQSRPIQGATGSSIVVHPILTTSYWVLVVNECGSTPSASATVSLACTNPVIVAGPQSGTISVGQTHLLYLNATGSAPLTYQWFIGPIGDQSNPISGALAPTLTVSPVTTTRYWVSATNPCGAVAAGATVTVATCAPPIIQEQPTSRSIFPGESTLLVVAATGDTPFFTYQWYVGAAGDRSTPISGATASSVLVTPTASTRYWVVVQSACSEVSSTTAWVTVLTCTPVIDVQPVGGAIATGGSFTMDVNGYGGPTAVTYNWFSSTDAGVTWNALGVSTYYLTVAPSQTTAYRARVSTTCGSAESEVAVVSVVPNCTSPAISSQPVSQSVPPGKYVTLAVNATGTEPISYQWYESHVDYTFWAPVIGGTTSSLSVTSRTDGFNNYYYATVSNNCGTIDSSVATISTGVVESSATTFTGTLQILPGGGTWQVAGYTLVLDRETKIKGRPTSGDTVRVIGKRFSDRPTKAIWIEKVH